MSDESSSQIDSVMHEDRQFPPSKQFVDRAQIDSMQAYEELYQRSIADPELFWSDLARQELHWFRDFETVCRKDEQGVGWFVEGQTNLSYNCLDAQIDAGHGDDAAGHVLVASRQGNIGIIPLGAHDGFNGIGNQVTRRQ